MNKADTIRAQSRKNPEQLEHEIDRQRDHIDEILQALEQRFSPGQLFAGAMNRGKDGGREFADNLARTVQANPVPALLTAAGLVWLYAGQGHPGATRRHDGRMSEKFDSAKERVGSARQRAGEKAHDAMDSTRERARRVSDGFQNMLENNPMAVGAMGIAAGALLGGLLPSTDTEDELMGGARDRTVDKARHAMDDGINQVKQAGRDVGEPASQSTPRH